MSLLENPMKKKFLGKTSLLKPLSLHQEKHLCINFSFPCLSDWPNQIYIFPSYLLPSGAFLFRAGFIPSSNRYLCTKFHISTFSRTWLELASTSQSRSYVSYALYASFEGCEKYISYQSMMSHSIAIQEKTFWRHHCKRFLSTLLYLSQEYPSLRKHQVGKVKAINLLYENSH